MSNVYYNPEEFGLVLVNCLDEPNLSYEYNTLIVLQHTATKRLFFAQDSGCSCPTPFENFHFSAVNADENWSFETNLIAITNPSWNNFEQAVETFPISMEDRQNCLTKVKALLRKSKTV